MEATQPPTYEYKCNKHLQQTFNKKWEETNMKKKVLSALLTTAMLASMLVGCGSSNEAPAASTDAAPAASTEAKTEAPASTEAAEPAAAEEGKVFNIYCWNEEFKSRLTDHYPGYEEVDGTTGKIGDITVKWNITPSDDNAYQNNLDETLLKQADAAADDKIDLFLIEADYALKYVDTDYTMPVKDLGITDADLANQYQYTKDVVTDSNGNLKGVSWQGCPGVLIYNREAAKAVLGTDDPAEVQKSVSDWDTFTATAEKMKAGGYNMVSSVNDTYRVYSNNVSGKWVQDGKIVIDDNLMKWVDDSKKMVDAKETGTFDLWSDDWSKGFYPDGKVFCYFGPAWLINFSMAADTDGSIANQGGWGATEGPQGFFWGGTWICGANGTDNKSLVKDIIEKILPVVDSFERGLATVENPEEDPFADGMNKVYKQFTTALDELGVTVIEAVGKEFDPNLHNAVMHVEDEEAGENIVVEEFLKGYMYKGSVVRHSMVKVAN